VLRLAVLAAATTAAEMSRNCAVRPDAPADLVWDTRALAPDATQDG
jgi:hypothetical protein